MTLSAEQVDDEMAKWVSHAQLIVALDRNPFILADGTAKGIAQAFLQSRELVTALEAEVARLRALLKEYVEADDEDLRVHASTYRASVAAIKEPKP